MTQPICDETSINQLINEIKYLLARLFLKQLYYYNGKWLWARFHETCMPFSSIFYQIQKRDFTLELYATFETLKKKSAVCRVCRTESLQTVGLKYMTSF